MAENKNKGGVYEKLLVNITADLCEKVCEGKMNKIQKIVISWEFNKLNSFNAINKIRKLTNVK